MTSGGIQERPMTKLTCPALRVMRASATPLRRYRPQALEARHDLSCAALAHTEELLDRRAVEVSGCHGTQGAVRISSSR